MVVVVDLESEHGLALLQRQGHPLEIAAVAVAVDAADADVVAASEREACADVASSTQPLLELS